MPMTPYKPTVRDNTARRALELLGDTYANRKLVRNIFGSSGIGSTGEASLVDFTPIGVGFAADEAGRQAGQGHPWAAAGNLALAALPIPGKAAVKGAVASGLRSAERIMKKTGKLPPKVSEAFANAISDAASKYKYVGLRTVDEPINGPILPSRVWANDKPTNRLLAGTSATDVYSKDVASQHGFESPDPRLGYYYGDYTYVIGSNKARRGADSGEIIMQDPKMVFGGRRDDFEPDITAQPNLFGQPQR